MLNRQLHDALEKVFGTVRISQEGQPRLVNGQGRDSTVVQRGEHYNVCCPLCGDTRFRLSISYTWLSKHPRTGKVVSSLAHCYNEDCSVRSPEFYQPVLDAMDGCDYFEPPQTDDQTVFVPKPTTFPETTIPLCELGDAHTAIRFLRKKYKTDMVSRADELGIYYVPEDERVVRQARDSVLFIIRDDSGPISWQARTLSPHAPARWLSSPGFIKNVYNAHNIPPSPFGVPVIAEGIPAAIACGPAGVALYGKEGSAAQIQFIAQRWSKVVLALDPETYIPDPRDKKSRVFAAVLAKRLHEAGLEVHSIRWPDDVLALASRYLLGSCKSCVDPADFGDRVMQHFIDAAEPAVNLGLTG